MLSVLLLFSPTAKFGPATTAKLINMQFSQVSGYGFFVASDRFSVDYYRATYTSHEPGSLLDVGDRWVQQREVDLWKVNCLVYKAGDFGLGLGVSLMDNSQLGWQVYAEKGFSNIVFTRLGFDYIYTEKPFTMVSAGFGVNLVGVIGRKRDAI